MITRINVAGLLAIVGAIGLAVAPAFGVPSKAPATAQNTVAVAITSGPQLRLTLAGEAERSNALVVASKRSLVCGDVYRLAIADVGFDCRSAQSTLASAD